MNPKTMTRRQQMPFVTARYDEVKAVFCTTPEDLASFIALIQAGVDGQPTFYGCENGITVGTKDTRQGVIPVVRTKAAQEAENALREMGKARR